MAAVLNGFSPSPRRPTAHLQIRYTSRLPNTRYSSPIMSSQSILTATITDTPDHWRITTYIRNTSSQPRSQSIKIDAWPMFSPEDAQFVASASTETAVAPGQQGKVEVEVAKRDLADFDERTGKYVLQEGMYMFELKSVEDVSVGVGIVKQVSVVGRMVWRLLKSRSRQFILFRP
ncbi:hypothetical protein LTR64_008552 [Lithohypha guttulata]|uniref:uncharacterized protein n=1 Tax=Lithohypha guttulata TaxID=1690604 RepID=UPI00315D1374